MSQDTGFTAAQAWAGSEGVASGIPQGGAVQAELAPHEAHPLMQDAGDTFGEREEADRLIPEEYAITLPADLPAGEVDGAMLDRFKEFCASSGLSPRQAQQAVDFYMGEQTSALNGLTEQCEMVLRSQWKEQFNTRLAQAKRACVAFDRRMQGRLMPLINTGLGSHPVFGELMAMVGESLSEDSFGRHSGGSVADEAMSTEEFLRTVVFKGR